MEDMGMKYCLKVWSYFVESQARKRMATHTGPWDILKAKPKYNKS
jgi:hypothetical protein